MTHCQGQCCRHCCSWLCSRLLHSIARVIGLLSPLRNRRPDYRCLHRSNQLVDQDSSTPCDQFYISWSRYSADGIQIYKYIRLYIKIYMLYTMNIMLYRIFKG